jgi:hypothetical protein
MDLDVGIVAVGLARQERLDLARVRLLSEAEQSLLRLGNDVVVPLLLAEGDQLDIIVEFAGQTVESGERGFELLALAHQALRAAAVAPKVRRLRLAVERCQPRPGLVGVKDAS